MNWLDKDNDILRSGKEEVICDLKCLLSLSNQACAGLKAVRLVDLLRLREDVEAALAADLADLQFTTK